MTDAELQLGTSRSGNRAAGVDIELLRFHTKAGCEQVKQRLVSLYKYETGDWYRRGRLNISDCFQENEGDKE